MRRPSEVVGDIVSRCTDLAAWWRQRDIDGTPFEAHLLHELVAISVFAAAAASVATALRDRLTLNTGAGGHAIWLPPPATHFHNLGRTVNLTHVHPQLLSALRSAHAGVDFARDLSTSLFADPRPGGGEAHADVVCDAWLRVCSQLLVALYEFQRLRPGLVAEPCCSRLPGVLELLKSVRAGRAPCLAADGTISVGAWAERRAARRCVVDIPVSVEAAAEHAYARLINVASGGLGLAGLELTCLSGETMLVTLPSGRTLAGEVRWQDADRLGLALFNRLPADDELFAAAPRSAPPVSARRRRH